MHATTWRARVAGWGPAARAWVVFLVAPNLGAAAGFLLGNVAGVGDHLLAWQSTTVGDVLTAGGLVVGGLVAGRLLLHQTGAAWKLDVPREEPDTSYWFPGRLLGGIALIASPVLLFAGELVRIQFHFYFPNQLAAFDAHPRLMLASYSLYALGLLLLWPAFLALVHLIGTRKPGWATWGGVLAITGLMVRLYHEGINHLAFQLVQVQGLPAAVHAVDESYPAWYVFYPLVFTDNLAWSVLAVGAYLSGRLSWLPSLALAVMLGHASGVLGSGLHSVSYAVGLVVVFVPLGVMLLRRSTPLTRSGYVVAGLVTAGLVGLYGYTIYALL